MAGIRMFQLRQTCGEAQRASNGRSGQRARPSVESEIADMEMQTPLPKPVRRRGFTGLMISQALGAFNDHAFKMLILLTVIEGHSGKFSKDALLGLTGLLFMIPLTLFSLPAGALSDRFSKRSVLIATKALEVVVMTLATVGFALNQIYFLLALYFLIALQASLYSPAKFGILPELLVEEELSMGNGLIEFLTFVPIVLGLVAPPFLWELCGKSLPKTSAILAGLAVAGLAATFLVPRLAPACPERKLSINPFVGLPKYTKLLREDRPLRLTVIGMVFFWAISFWLLQGSLLYAEHVLRLDVKAQTMANMALAIGVGVGSALAGVLSDHKVELGLVPLGTAGKLVWSVALAFMHGVRLGFVLPAFGLLGASSGFFIVPPHPLLPPGGP